MQIPAIEGEVSTSYASRWIEALSRGLPVPPDATAQQRRTYHMASLAFPPSLIAHFLFIFLFAYWGIPALVLFNVLSVLLYIATVLLTNRFKVNLALAILIGEFVVSTSLIVYFVG